jgi:hypothetical protein
MRDRLVVARRRLVGEVVAFAPPRLRETFVALGESLGDRVEFGVRDRRDRDRLRVPGTKNRKTQAIPPKRETERAAGSETDPEEGQRT